MTGVPRSIARRLCASPPASFAGCYCAFRAQNVQKSVQSLASSAPQCVSARGRLAGRGSREQANLRVICAGAEQQSQPTRALEQAKVASIIQTKCAPENCTRFSHLSLLLPVGAKLVVASTVVFEPSRE